MSNNATAVARQAEDYYDSPSADEFYRVIWGGEDIHVGIYDPTDRDIAEASRDTVRRMAARLKDLGPETRVLDIGAGYGGSARHLAKAFGCHVTCLNISEIQNDYNRKLNAQAGLDKLITVKHGNFEALPEEDASYDVVWCQDAILHSANREQVCREVARVLKPGGQFIFTDPMAADDCPPGVLDPILKRLNLPSLATPGFYAGEFRKLGFEKIEYEEMTRHLRNHYSNVRKELQRRYDEMERMGFKEYVDAMLTGLGHWVDGGDKGYLSWGIMLIEKPR
jgi:sarcosine/dimethylglycine N-methyltransferase